MGVAGSAVLLRRLEPQAGAVDGVRVLPALGRAPRPAPAIAPLRGTALRWPEETVSPVRASMVRASISSASRAKVQGGRSVAEPPGTSRATASAPPRLRGVRPRPGRD